jgi:cap2 methyltransferase
MKLFTFNNHHKNIQFVTDNGLLNYIDANKRKLIDIKCKIDGHDIHKWERSKKSNNQYEYIYTSSRNNKNICNISPVSRSYFKLYEMIIDFELVDTDIFCASLAEGPGGFIHCLNDFMLQKDITIHKCYGITLLSDDKKVPYWNPLIINNKQNEIIYGKDNTGDLYNLENVDTFINMVKQNPCHLITGDGGFDYSDDYNSQEISSYRLFYSEIFIALHTQKVGGHFVLKVFDLFDYKTIQLLYLLYCHYEKVHIYKPSTSRLSNSEKYIICKSFCGCSDETKHTLHELFNKCNELVIDIPKSFLDELKTYNTSFTELQIKKIEEILQSIHTSKNYPTKKQIEDAKEWCTTYNLTTNKSCIYLKSIH